jgi:hypothetical protein
VLAEVVPGVDTAVLVHNCGTGEAGPLFRADDRDPSEIFANGFQPKGDDLDINAHVNSNPEDDGFISTSKTEGAARQFAYDNYMDDGYIYKVRGSRIDVNETFGDQSPFPYEEEMAVPGPIGPSDIEGAWSLSSGEWTPNPGFGQ